jgi:hypothetical protein
MQREERLLEIGIVIIFKTGLIRLGENFPSHRNMAEQKLYNN